MFPSPYGVSFILIICTSSDCSSCWCWFPSPYGVSFILILICLGFSVGDNGVMFPSPYGVSFILIWSLTITITKKDK